MTKVLTKPFTTIQKIINMNTPKGKAVNRFAQGLIQDGYSNIYQRALKYDRVAITGKNATGNTKTFILSRSGFRVKTNDVIPVTKHTAVREIDKATFNEFGGEIFGIKKIQRLINNNIFDTKIEKRGWGVNN